MAKLKKYLKDFFRFSRGEKDGIVSLGILILISFLLIIAVVYLNYTSLINSDSKQQATTMDSLVAVIKQETAEANFVKNAQYKEKQIASTKSFKNKLESFNPNNFNLAIGENIGLSTKQSQSIINYLQKGGKFEIKSDFKKMYVISDEKYQELENYILLPTVKEENKSSASNDIPKNEAKTAYKVKAVDVNLADSATLESLYGIGPYYAKSIVEYREKLGGYISLWQLMELYKMDEEKFEKMTTYLVLDDKNIRKININKITIEELRKHPYFNWNLSKSLVNYRAAHGNFKQLEDLHQLHLIDTNLYRKIVPYLSL